MSTLTVQNVSIYQHHVIFKNFYSAYSFPLVVTARPQCSFSLYMHSFIYVWRLKGTCMQISEFPFLCSNSSLVLCPTNFSATVAPNFDLCLLNSTIPACILELYFSALQITKCLQAESQRKHSTYRCIYFLSGVTIL